MDFSQYPAWNPMICAAELAPGRAPEPGVELRISIALGLGPTVKGVPTRLVRVSPARELCWVGGLRGVFRGQHYFRLERLEDGTTRLVHGERFSGALVPMVVGLSRPVLTRSYARLNEALKRRCEGRAR